MSTRSENRLWTGGIFTLALAALGVGAWVLTGGVKYVAPGVLVVLCGAFLIFMAFAGRRKEEGTGK